MQLPRLRLPRPRLSFEWLGALGNRMLWLYLGYTLLLFVVFLILTFPHDILIHRALSLVNQGGGLEFNSARFAWYKGYEISGVKLAPSHDGEVPILELSHIWIRPVLSQLLRGNPYTLRLEGDLYGGEAEGELDFADGRFSGTVLFEGIDVGRYRTLTALLDEGRIAGHLSGQFDFEGRGASLENAQGNGEIVLDGAAIAEAKVQGYTVPDLSLKQTKLKFTVRTGRLEVQEFSATGDVNAQGSGQIVLRTPLQDSALNLRATVLPTATTPDAVKALISLIPRTPGSKPDAPMTVTGTLARPRVR
jgi:type II secretion system protein N